MKWGSGSEARSSAVLRAAIVLVLMALPAALAVAGGEHEGVVNATDGVAIGGYDPVAYFADGAPTEGNEAHAYDWDGATWWFTSAEHRELFVAEPERYAPRYGGYCAFAAARNQVAEGDPELWTIHDGRLYLNFNDRTHRQFLADLPNQVEAADANWPALRAELAASTAQK